MKIAIMRNFSARRGVRLFETEVSDTDPQPMGTALTRACANGADLRGAELQDDLLQGADLQDALLLDANLQGADLRGADLRGALLQSARLQGTNLRGADLRGALLGDADLRGARLLGADLRNAQLLGTDLEGAYLSGAIGLPSHIPAVDPPKGYVRKPRAEALAEQAAKYHAEHPGVPVVPHLGQRILEIISKGDGILDMDDWHTCETTHCRAGWAIHLAGAAGRDLEKQFDSEIAGAMIYRASTGRVPNFYASAELAFKDIRRCAEEFSF